MSNLGNIGEEKLVLLSRMKKNKEVVQLYQVTINSENSVYLQNYCTKEGTLLNGANNLKELFPDALFIEEIEGSIEDGFGKLMDNMDEPTRVMFLKALYEGDIRTYEQALDDFTVYQQEKLFLSVLDRDIDKFKSGCPLCHNKGYYIDELGIEVECECQRRDFKSKNGKIRNRRALKEKIAQKEQQTEEENETQTKIEDIVEKLTGSRSLTTVYDTDKVMQDIQQVASLGKFKLVGFKEYDNLLKNIINAVQNGNTKDLNSYLIGAPSGFGQNEFVDQCLIALVKRGIKAVPLMSLSELMSRRIEHNEKVLNAMFDSKAKVYSKGFGWDDYVNADIVFVKLEDLDNKFMETKALYMLLQARGAKKLPTIVFINFALSLYLKDTELKRYLWEDMVHWNRESETTDKCKLNRVSTYKKY